MVLLALVFWCTTQFASALRMSVAAPGALEQKLRSQASSMFEEVELRARGRGSPHRTSKLRLFDAKESQEPRVVFYRDSAAWCPYCQKTWMLLEEKRIPYRVELINMRSYGTKPKSFTDRVPGGFLPAVELDGRMYTESLDIMVMLDRVFTEPDHRSMLPERSVERARELLALERKLFSSWCGFLFRPSLFGRQQFDRDLEAVEAALQASSGPFFLDGSECSLVDLQYASHLERMCASAAYWKGVDIRAKYPAIDAWFRALEELPSYDATRSDFYTHVMDIPPQYGQPSFSDERFASITDSSTWRFPLAADPLQPNWGHKEQGAALEAAFELFRNLGNVAAFASRPAGPGRLGEWARGRPDRARLADPGAPPAEGRVIQDVETALRAAVQALVDMHAAGAAEPAAAESKVFEDWAVDRRRVTAECLAYLRDRVGVPRDMSYPAARHLRAALNWLIADLTTM